MPRQNNRARVTLRVVKPAADWLSVEDVEGEVKSWIRAGQGYSEGSLENRNRTVGKLVWFLRHRGYTRCGREEVEEFFEYLATAHKRGGRFEKKDTRPLRPASLAFYFTKLRAFFNRLVKVGVLAESPMARLEAPPVRENQIQPFTEEQVEALFRAARASADPVREEAILMMLFDTGIRASELCRLTIGDFDLTNHRCTVLGKGNKIRHLQLGEAASRAVRRLIGEYRDPSHPERPADRSQSVFTSRRGRTTGAALTRFGLYRIIRTLGEAAGVEQVRCSPHTMRHSFAISYLRNGGPVFSLQTQLGHESLAQSRRYVNLADADLQSAHMLASPADNLFGRKRKR